MLKLISRPEPQLTFEVDNEDFRSFAIQAHGDQTYGAYPYALHLADVENTLTNHSYSSYHDRAIAWLHDIIEDTQVTYDMLEKWYGPIVAGDVDACTGIGPNRKSRNERIYRLCNERPRAAAYKVADRLSNLKHGIATKNIKKLTMYSGEAKDFCEAFRPLMTSTTKSGLLWIDLEAALSTAYQMARANPLAVAA